MAGRGISSHVHKSTGKNTHKSLQSSSKWNLGFLCPFWAGMAWERGLGWAWSQVTHCKWWLTSLCCYIENHSLRTRTYSRTVLQAEAEDDHESRSTLWGECSSAAWKPPARHRCNISRPCGVFSYYTLSMGPVILLLSETKLLQTHWCQDPSSDR